VQLPGWFGILIMSYLLGSIPFELLVVKWRTGKDVRKVGSGCTGGTNAMRVAGYGIGVLTLVMDSLKAACAVWLARRLANGNVWIEVAAPLLAILGHNYSIFLKERDERGRIRFRGGAGGAPALGGALGLWPPIVLVIVPIDVLIFFGVGYASVTTLSVGILAMIVFGLRAWRGLSPWGYVFFGLVAEMLLLWNLRPNIRNLIQGTERGVSWRARKK